MIKEDKSKKNPKIYQLKIIMMIFLTLYLAVNLILFFFIKNKIYSLISTLIFVPLFMIIINVYSKNFNHNYSNLNYFFLILNELITNSFNLLNVFYTYFDNTFLLVRQIFEQKKEELEKISKVSLLTKSELLNNINLYINNIMLNDFFSKNNHICTDINEKCEMFNKEIHSFIEIVNQSETAIKDDIDKRLEVYKDKDFYHKVIVEFGYYSEIISQFIIAFVNSSKTLAGDFSIQIFEMKKNISTFINNIDQWKNDFFDKKSQFNFDKVIVKYKIQNEQLNSIYSLIDDNYKTLEKKLNSIVSMIEKIFDNTSHIQEIADKINMLAINASIESSRSEKDGKGFKVIAGEIKNLANYTMSFVENIVSIISEAKEITVNTTCDFKENNKKITKQINYNKEQLNLFYETLQSYYKNFNSMFQSVSELTNEINKHIDKFNVLIQHYDIEEQQMGNLMKIIRNFQTDNADNLFRIIDSLDKNKKHQILINIIDFIEKIITTNVEYEMLKNVKNKYNIAVNAKDITNNDIELF